MTVTKRGPRGPYAKTALRRAGIVDAALALVIEKGHRDVTTTEIAERAGVTESTLLYHFPTKDHLLVAVLAESEERDRQREAALAASGNLHSETELAASEQSEREGRARPSDQEWNAEVIGRQAELNVAHAETLRLFVRMAAEATEPSHPAHDWFLAHHRAAYAEFADALRRMQDAGQAHPDVDPERFARQMVAVWDGLQSQWLIDPSFDLADEVVAAFRTLAREDAMAAKRAMEALAAGL